MILFLLGLAVGVAAASAIAIRARRKQSARVERIAEYLENTALGTASALQPSDEGDLSRLQDEIGKTVTALRQARLQADQAKEDYARNLSNIAHQIKTPLSVISLAAQRMAGEGAERERLTILSQVDRLEKLQGDLLLMAKLDAGALAMNLEEQDLLTLLSIAADNIEELARQAGVTINVLDNGSVAIIADEHWFCEALMNVMKNCVEHSPVGGEVRVEYAANPLYAEVSVTDEGQGFENVAKGRLFERFYTGSRSAAGNTGLGLAFARELIELQNGSIQARERVEGGACFDIRIYGHSDVTLNE